MMPQKQFQVVLITCYFYVSGNKENCKFLRTSKTGTGFNLTNYVSVCYRNWNSLELAEPVIVSKNRMGFK